MIILEHNVTTGVITKRDATVDELAQEAKNLQQELLRKNELEAKDKAKAALLDRLGITADEAKLLLS